VRSSPAAEVQAAVAAGAFDLALVPDLADDASRASERWLGQVDPWFDVLVGAADRADGLDDKRALYAEMQRIWSDALPGLPLYQRLRVDIAASSLSGIQPPPQDEALTWNVALWRFETR
jgi:ABC-type transport system substrate-binding protein